MEIPDPMKALHEGLANHFQTILDGGQPTAAEMNTIRQFLKDNDVTLLQLLNLGADTPVMKLADHLPTFDDETGPMDARKLS